VIGRAAALAAALALTASAGAAGEPFAVSAAKLRTLTVTSRALVSPTSVDLRGGWHDTKLSCSVERSVAVRARVDYVTPAGKTRRTAVSRAFRSPNCADGGPSEGFTLTARQLGDACSNGTWRPGHYTFVVKTLEPASGLQAVASLAWPKPARC
jgi:hypothetical protein